MNLIQKLQSAGLTEYESKIFLTLISHGTLSAREISKFSGVPKNRVYDSIEELERKGMINIILGKVKKFQSIQPEKAINNLFNFQLSELENKKEEAKTLFKAMQNLQKKSHENIVVWTFSGSREEIAKKRIEIRGIAEKEWKAIIAAEKMYEYPTTMHNFITNKIKKGVSIRIIFTDNEVCKKIGSIWEKFGVKVKFQRIPNDMKFEIMDNKLVILESTRGSLGEWFLIWTNSPPIVEFFSKTFDMYWKNS